MKLKYRTVCVTCGKEVFSNRLGRKFCSQNCNTIHWGLEKKRQREIVSGKPCRSYLEILDMKPCPKCKSRWVSMTQEGNVMKAICFNCWFEGKEFSETACRNESAAVNRALEDWNNLDRNLD